MTDSDYKLATGREWQHRVLEYLRASGVDAELTYRQRGDRFSGLGPFVVGISARHSLLPMIFDETKQAATSDGAGNMAVAITRRQLHNTADAFVSLSLADFVRVVAMLNPELVSADPLPQRATRNVWRQCAHCGTDFELITSSRRFCSTACRSAGQRTRAATQRPAPEYATAPAPR